MAGDVAIAIRSTLLAESSITDLIGQRMYADRLPQNCNLPAVELTVVSDVPTMMLSDLAGITKARLTFACIANRRQTARQIARAIRLCGICAVKGLVGDVNIRGVAVDTQFDSPIDPTDGTDESRYQSSLDLIVDYIEEN